MEKFATQSFNWATSQQKWIDDDRDEQEKEDLLFQLGHFLAEMDRCKTSPESTNIKSFQLGHFLAEMDRNLCIFHTHTLHPYVSIGPLLSRNGQVDVRMVVNTVLGVSIGPLLSRNGQRFAAGLILCILLGFNWATSQQKWIGNVASHRLDIDRRSFNWATSQQKWIACSHETKDVQNRAFQLGHFLAEMDRITASRWGIQPRPCFNWATSQQKWIDGWSVFNHMHTSCFNWATSQQKWIVRDMFIL